MFCDTGAQRSVAINNFMRKLAIFLFVILTLQSCIFLYRENGYAKDYEKFQVPEGVNSPRTLSAWLNKNIKYIPDKYSRDEWKFPSKTVKDGGGDCDDYAILVSLILSKLGYKTSVVAIHFLDEGKISGHAICLFQEEDGTWSVFDNQLYRRLKARHFREILKRTYPTWIEVVFVRQNGTVIKRIENEVFKQKNN